MFKKRLVSNTVILTKMSAIFCETNAASSIYNDFRETIKN